MSFKLQTPAGSSAIAAVALLPIVIPVAYLLYINRQVSNSTNSRIGRYQDHDVASTSPSEGGLGAPTCLPEHVRSDSAAWVISYERIESHPVAVSALIVPMAESHGEFSSEQTHNASKLPSDLLKTYLRATHDAFSRTPQAFLIRMMIGEPEVKRTFDTDWIRRLSFKHDDIVNGVYRVNYIGNGGYLGCERVELALESPPSYNGPKDDGLILSAIEPCNCKRSTDMHHGDQEAMVRFINETWMWRPKDGKPTLLESGVGQRMHSLLAGWLILNGIKAVTTTHFKMA